MMNLDKIVDKTGYLVLNEEGAVVSSWGDLENDERLAGVVMGLLTITDTVIPGENYNRITVNYPQHSYAICLSNKRIYIVKRLNSTPTRNDPVV